MLNCYESSAQTEHAVKYRLKLINPELYTAESLLVEYLLIEPIYQFWILTEHLLHHLYIHIYI